MKITENISLLKVEEQDNCVQLAREIVTNGFLYVLVDRCDVAQKAIYAQCYPHRKESPVGFEVFYIKRAFKKPNPRASAKERRWVECYPSTSDWGHSAWTYINKARALKHYEKMERRVKK